MSVDNWLVIGVIRVPIKTHLRIKAALLGKGLKLWKVYNEKLYSYLQKGEFPLVSFDVEKHEYISAFRRISIYFGLPKTAKNNESFFDHTLKHQKLAELRDELPSDIGKLYDDLSQIYINQKTL